MPLSVFVAGVTMKQAGLAGIGHGLNVVPIFQLQNDVVYGLRVH